MTVTPLARAVAANLVLMVLGAVVSIQQHLPYEFGGHGNPDRVAQDFFSGGGTAAAPPFVVIVALAVLGLLAAAAGRGAAIAVGLVGVLGIVGVVGFAGEPHTWRVFSSVQVGWAAYVVLSFAAIAWLLFESVRELRTRAGAGWRRPA